MERSGAYIPSIDAKDIYIANHYRDGIGGGYSLRQANGEYNLRRFINSFDYQLDYIHLSQVCPDFTQAIGRKRYSTKIINVTFKYSYKTYNNIRKDFYVKAGINPDHITLENSIHTEGGELLAIRTNEVTDPPNDTILCIISAAGFRYDESRHVYTLKGDPPTIMSRSDLRTDLYRNGFWADGTHYVRMKRSSGSARVGKCLFIDESLYDELHEWEMCGLSVKSGEAVDLAALESYISLSTSSIVNTIEIDPRSILIIDDYDSEFEEVCINVREVDGHLKAAREPVTVCNSIWDGQSLADSSIFPPGTHWGMMLLRNKFFKSCCFNCNLQQWFADNGISDVSQLNGFTLAKRIEDIKLITTPNSIKYLKFGEAEDWLNNLPSTFGVVKHEKRTKYFGGNAVQAHYQLLSTLQLTEDEMRVFLQPSLDFAQALKTDPAVVRYFIKFPEDKEYSPVPMLTNNDVVYNMMSVNERFTKTKYYRDFTVDLLRAFYGNLKCGHVLVDGNYSVMCGNPIEMLLHAIGRFNGESQIGVGNIHSSRFSYDVDILGSRSPHVAMGNILVTHNTQNELIDRYMNATPEIVYINSINENILNRLSGAD